MVGNAENLFVDCQCEDLGEGLIRINVLQKYTGKNAGKTKGKKLELYNKTGRQSTNALYALPLSEVKRMTGMPRSVSALFSTGKKIDIPKPPDTSNKEYGWKSSPLAAQSSAKDLKNNTLKQKTNGFPNNQYVILPEKEITKKRSKTTNKNRQNHKKTIKPILTERTVVLPKVEKQVMGYSPVKAMQINSENEGHDALKDFFGENKQ